MRIIAYRIIEVPANLAPNVSLYRGPERRAAYAAHCPTNRLAMPSVADRCMKTLEQSSELVPAPST